MSTLPACGFRLRTFRSIGGLRYGAATAVSPASLSVVPQSRSASTSHLVTLTCSLLKYDIRLTPSVRSTRPFCSGNLPPHKRIALPALSPTMENGNIVSWQKKEGDQLSEGDLLCEIETDKATMGFETPEEGYLAKICIPEGTKGVPIGKLLCIIVESEDSVVAFKDFKDDGAPAPAAAQAEVPAPSSAPSSPPASSGGDFPPCSHVALPALSPTMETGNIVSWQKKEGDQLAEGDVLCEIETDKATMSFETPEEGYLAKIVIPQGTKGVPIGKLLCVIVDSEDKVAAFKNFKDDGAKVIPKPPPAAAAPSAPPPAAGAPAATAPSGGLPPCNRVALPALSPTMESGKIVSWQKKEGDQLAEGDVLCEIETDKATMSFETPEEGYLAKIVIPEGTKGVPIGKLLCIIVDSQDKVAAFKDFKDDGATVIPEAPAASAVGAVPSKPATVPPPTPAAAPAAAPHPGGRVCATPFARKLAAERGVDISGVAGSGPGGRILAADLARAPAGGVPAAARTPAATGGPAVPAVPGADYTDIPLSNMRQTIAKRLTESKSTIPHYYLTAEINIDALLKVREKLNKMLAQGTGGSTKLSINDFIVKASALACLRVPEANSFWMDSFIRQNNTVDVSVAVSTPGGLITPIIFNAHAKGLATISNEVKELAARAREGKLQPNEFQGGTFTVSNLGMYGSVTDFTAIINPPQSCILAVGGTETKMVPSEQEEYRSIKVMKVTLSCDHRVVDGAVGAVWLRHFKEFLEKPHTMLL